MRPYETMRTLLETPTVRSLVQQRIYGDVAPQGTKTPYITFQRISHRREHASAGPVDLQMPVFQVNCWADSLDAANDLGDAVVAACDAHASPNSPAARADGGLNSIEPATEGSEEHTHVVRVEVELLVFAGA